jgi:hypothetical protein
MTIEMMKKLIVSEQRNFAEDPDIKLITYNNVKTLLDTLILFANRLYVDDTFTSYGDVWFHLAPHFPYKLDTIEIENIFQLHYVLDFKLFAEKQSDDTYSITSQLYHDYTFAEIVSADVYDEIYRDITTTLHDADISF